MYSYDISLHQHLLAEQLLSWNYFKIGKSDLYTCPIQVCAVLVHDYPVET